MSWLKLDDGFASHPKIGALSHYEFRVWLRLLCFCARYQDPSVDQVALNEVSGLTPARVARFSELCLLDREGPAYVVHDWLSYQPRDATGAERQAAWRARRNGRVTI